MRKKKKQSQPIKIIALMALLVPLSLYILVSTVGRKNFTLPHRVALEIIGPVQNVFSKTIGIGSNVWHHYISLVQVATENDQLRREIKKYKKANAAYREAAAINGQLQKNLDLENSTSDPEITAKIIGRDPSLWFKTLTINKGSISGIEKGMPAITPEGVAGQVINVSRHYAKIIVATDPNSAIDAIVQKNRTQGIIKGDSRGYQLRYILKNNTINQGDQIITSGMGGIFPKGLAIGQVSEIIKSRRGMFQKIKVTPAVDFHRLEYLVIILHKQPMIE